MSMNSATSPDVGQAGHDRLVARYYDLLQRVQPTIFCDVGAYDGSAGAEVKRRLPDCEVMAFEANPRIHAKFKDDARLAQISYRNLVISDRAGMTKLYPPKMMFETYVDRDLVPSTKPERPDTKRTSLLPRTQNASYEDCEALSIRLDDVMRREFGDLGRHRVALWIDVEGAVDKVLAGAPETLASSSAVMVEAETMQFWKDQKLASDISSTLMNSGFVPVARDREIDDRQFNILFLHHRVLPLVYPDLFLLAQRPE